MIKMAKTTISTKQLSPMENLKRILKVFQLEIEDQSTMMTMTTITRNSFIPICVSQLLLQRKIRTSARNQTSKDASVSIHASLASAALMSLS